MPTQDLNDQPIRVLYNGPVLSIDGVGYCHHVNGGGLVAETAYVEDSVWVGPQAMVMGNAVVKGECNINQSAIVKDSAHLRGAVLVSNRAVVEGHAQLSGKVQVLNDRRIGGDEVYTAETCTTI